MSFIADDVLRRLRDAKVFSIDVIIRHLHCSVRTAWRRLRELNTFTSYNHNAKYHALPDTPRFNEYGIWRYEDIGFSRHGNLTRTVRHLVDHSPDGMTAQQICTILGVSAASLYTFFRNIPGIAPHRDGQSLVFFSEKEELRTLQVVRRCESNVPLRSTDAVLVLVDRIKHPDDTVEQCVRRLRYQSAAITPRAVRLLLERHGIVKKTAEKP